MIKTSVERTEWPFLTATAAGRGLGGFPIGSPQSRAAARALLEARQGSQADEAWDRELDATRLAERFAAARQREKTGDAHRVKWSPIQIPPGKENTVRGRLAARMNAAEERMARLAVEREAE